MKQIIIVILLFQIFIQTASAATVDYNYKIYQDVIEYEAGKTKTTNKKSFPIIGITSHHLPTAAPLIANFYAELKKRRSNIKCFIIIGPDHFEKCRNNFSYSKDKMRTAFGTVYPDQKIAYELDKLGAKTDDNCFVNEHAIGVQANFIKKFFPDASVTPIVLSDSARTRDFSSLQAYLSKNKNIFVVASLDFSHYLNKKDADKIDALTRVKMQNIDSRNLELKNVDSPATLKFVLDYAKLNRLKPEILLHKNSAEYDGNWSFTTSYFNVFYSSDI